MWSVFKVIQDNIEELGDDEHDRCFDELRKYQVQVARSTNLIESERPSPALDIYKW